MQTQENQSQPGIRVTNIDYAADEDLYLELRDDGLYYPVWQPASSQFSAGELGCIRVPPLKTGGYADPAVATLWGAIISDIWGVIMLSNLTDEQVSAAADKLRAQNLILPIKDVRSRQPIAGTMLATHFTDQEYAVRVRELEAEGLTTSDAQGVADAEHLRATTTRYTTPVRVPERSRGADL